MKFSNVFSAEPLLIAAFARSMPSLISFEFPVRYISNAALNTAISYFAPFSFPEKMSAIIAAFSSVFPPCISFRTALLRPKSSGEIS